MDKKDMCARARAQQHTLQCKKVGLKKSILEGKLSAKSLYSTAKSQS